MSCLTETPFDRIKQEELPDDYRRVLQDFWASFAEKLMQTNINDKDEKK